MPSGIRLTANRPPARRLRHVSCEVVRANESGSTQPSSAHRVWWSWVYPIPESCHVLSKPSDLGGFPLRMVSESTSFIDSFCRKKIRIFRILSVFPCHCPDFIHIPACSARTQSWSPNCSGGTGLRTTPL